MNTIRRAIFLDRDGVLTRSEVREGKPFAPRSLATFELIPGAREAVQVLRTHGFCLIVVTNQPDVATGKLSRELVDQMHACLRSWLPLDDIKVCCHVDADNCQCRKPKPGMLIDAAREWSIDLKNSFMVGDRWRDVSAGKAAGCKTVFIEYHYDEPQRDRPDFVVTSIGEAAMVIVQSSSELYSDRNVPHAETE